MIFDQPSSVAIYVPVDFSNAWKGVQRIVNSSIALLPNLVLAIVLFCIFLLLASVVKSVVRRVSEKRLRRRNMGVLLGQTAHVLVVILGLLIALSTVAPSYRASDLVKTLGIGSVAIGFAFQNILQNFLAGVLLLVHEPFRIGDWISATGLEGTVEDIQTRATIVLTPDKKRIVIPNAILFTNPVTVGGAPKEESKNPQAGGAP